MQVEQIKLVKLLENIGLDIARKWSVEELAERVNFPGGIRRYLDPGKLPSDPDCRVLFSLIESAQMVKPIQVIPSEMPPEPPEPRERPVRKTHSASQEKKSNRYDGHPSYAAWVAFLKKNPKSLPEEGILSVLVRELRAAGLGSKPKPVTKGYLLGVLKREFPDRDPLKMETNINNVVPTRLRWMYGIHVWRQRMPDGSLGFCIVGDGSRPQPSKFFYENRKKQKASGV